MVLSSVKFPLVEPHTNTDSSLGTGSLQHIRLRPLLSRLLGDLGPYQRLDTLWSFIDQLAQSQVRLRQWRPEEPIS
jgi:hypothetical protein